MTTNPRWTDEELLLALEVTDRRGWRAGNKTTPEFTALSRLLRSANLANAQVIDERYRSPSSVSLKVSNLVGANPRVPGGMRDSKREVALVERFLANRDVMLSEAVALRSRLQRTDLEPDFVSDLWDEEELNVATEGGADHVLTLRRERSRPLRGQKSTTFDAWANP